MIEQVEGLLIQSKPFPAELASFGVVVAIKQYIRETVVYRQKLPVPGLACTKVSKFPEGQFRIKFEAVDLLTQNFGQSYPFIIVQVKLAHQLAGLAQQLFGQYAILVHIQSVEEHVTGVTLVR